MTGLAINVTWSRRKADDAYKGVLNYEVKR